MYLCTFFKIKTTGHPSRLHKMIVISRHRYKGRTFEDTSPPEVFFGIGVIKICSKFTGEHP